jgi:hypothetical protein
MSVADTDILIDLIRRSVVAEEFEANIGSRAFILTAEFPFLYIGEIVDVEGNFIFLCIETTHISELEGRVIRIFIGNIDVFYIENGGPCIPKIC